MRKIIHNNNNDPDISESLNNTYATTKAWGSYDHDSMFIINTNTSDGNNYTSLAFYAVSWLILLIISLILLMIIPFCINIISKEEKSILNTVV